MKIQNTPISDVKILMPQRFKDKRGFFAETYNSKKFFEAGFDINFVQDNHSLSHEPGTLRGMHYQSPPAAQAKLVRCGRGAIFDVVVDIRIGSPTYGKWFGYKLTAEDGDQIFVPIGFAHGFVSLEPNSEIIYKCTEYYAPEKEGTIRWDSCGIEWLLNSDPILSYKDSIAISLSDLNSPFIFGKNS